MAVVWMNVHAGWREKHLPEPNDEANPTVPKSIMVPFVDPVPRQPAEPYNRNRPGIIRDIDHES